MQKSAKKITENKTFHNFIMMVILFASILVGLETSPTLYTNYRSVFHSLDLLVQGSFTLEGWVEVYKSQTDVIGATIYFITFILLGTMIILNLFIGVIIDGFDEIKKEVEESSEEETSEIKLELKKARLQIESLRGILDRISSKVK